MNFDLIIKGGTIIDGSGEARFSGDVGIKDGKIAAIGDVTGDAAQVIDATGKMVSPGFIDIHTHYDAQVVWDSMLSISPWHGVTTVVMGNCGFGIAPTRAADRELILGTLEKVEGMSLEGLNAGLGEDWGFESFPEYMDVVEGKGSSINVSLLLGHTPLRFYVMGKEATERAATKDEVQQMKDILKEAMEAGALGFSSSKSMTHVGYEGRPVPSRLADKEEMYALGSVLGDMNRGTIQTAIGKTFFHSEIEELAEVTGRPISWTALLGGMSGPRSHIKHLKETEKLAAKGLPVFPQVSCRPLNFEFDLRNPFILEGKPLFQPISSSDFDGKKAIYADPEFRQRFKDEAGPDIKPAFGTNWKQTVVSFCPSEPELEERQIMEIAEERGVHTIDLVCDLSLRDNLDVRFRMPVLNTEEEDVAELLRDPNTIIGLSDAGAHASQLCDACFSTFLLEHWVRDKKVLTLEEAVYMLTSQVANAFGLNDRGLLAEGRPADVVVFDADTVAASDLYRVNDMPGGAERVLSDAIGIDAVIVNGVMLRRNGEDQMTAKDKLPGKLLRGGSAA